MHIEKLSQKIAREECVFLHFLAYFSSTFFQLFDVKLYHLHYDVFPHIIIHFYSYDSLQHMKFHETILVQE
jgi:hypothetical protein